MKLRYRSGSHPKAVGAKETAKSYCEHPYTGTVMDALRVGQAAGDYLARKARERTVLLEGARQGSTACREELHRQGLTFWWQPGRTILDRRPETREP